MTLAAGTRVGPYEIHSTLGEGGMGVVYRARDTNLKRDVALKSLPDEFARDPERVARFQREAEALAALNHPHIAAIHYLQEGDSGRFLVLELVEGETLAERLARGGAMPIRDALTTARQIAEACEAAHERGIVHRDLKPANIKTAPDGAVKVLDFGLAKMKAQPVAGPALAGVSQSPTAIGATMSGAVLGTAAYMSPEQARGFDTDRTADVWAFGCVLFEMLTGRQAFPGQTVTDILSAVVGKEPDWTRLPPQTPQSIRTLLRRCLQKERRSRLHDIADARLEIEDTLNHAHESPTLTTRPTREPLAWTIAVVAVVALVAVSTTAYLRRPTDDAPETRLQIVGPFSDPRPPVISPDGRALVFAAQAAGKMQLWLRPLNSLQAHPLSGTENGELPFWSPDSRSLAFFANGKLKRVSASGGAAEVVASTDAGRGGTWNRDNVILFAAGYGTGLFRVDSSGGAVTPVTKPSPGELSHRLPQFLPDGRHFLYYVQGSTPGVFVGGLDGGTHRILAADSQASFVAPGWLLFVRENKLFVQAFDSNALAPSGEPTLVADEINLSSEVASMAAFSVSDNHTLVYRTGDPSEARQLAWFDRTGQMIRAFARESGAIVNPSLSPDGSQVAFNKPSGTFDVWVLDTIRGNVTRVTTTPTMEVHPIWTSTGRSIVFSSNERGHYGLFQHAVGSTGPNEPLLENSVGGAMTPRDVSLDGRFLLYNISSPATGWDIWALPLSGNKKPFPVVVTSFEEREPVFSPDAKWIAYQTDETGRFEIYAQPFPGGSGKVPISSNGGTQARWSRDGKEIFYIGPDGSLMTVPVSVDGDALRAGSPSALFRTHIAGGVVVPAPNKQQYDVSKDGRQFIINTSTDEAATTAMTVILNWKLPDR